MSHLYYSVVSLDNIDPKEAEQIRTISNAIYKKQLQYATNLINGKNKIVFSGQKAGDPTVTIAKAIIPYKRKRVPVYFISYRFPGQSIINQSLTLPNFEKSLIDEKPENRERIKAVVENSIPEFIRS